MYQHKTPTCPLRVDSIYQRDYSRYYLWSWTLSTLFVCWVTIEQKIPLTESQNGAKFLIWKKTLSLTKLRKLKIFSFPKSNWFWFELNGFLWCQFLCHFFLFAVGRATKNVKNGESPCKYCFVKRSLNHVRLWKSILTRQLLYKTSSDVTKTLSSKVDTVGFQAAVIIRLTTTLLHAILQQKLYRRISFVQNCLSTNYTVVLFVQSLTNKSFPRQISTFFLHWNLINMISSKK